MARINFKTIAKNVDYTTFATYQEMLSYAGGSLSYPGQILGVLQAHDTPDNVTPFILDANKTPVGIASFTKVQEMIEDQIGNMAGALVLQGNTPSDEFNNALTNHTAGWTFVVTTSGTYVGQACNIGDMIICKTTGTSANNADWFVVESNQPNMVTSDISSPLNQEVPVFGATGKTIGGSGISMGQVATILENQLQKGAGNLLTTEELNGIKQQLGVGSEAAKLTTARTIDGVEFDGTGNVTHFCVCSTAAGTAAKTVNLPGFVIAPNQAYTGARISVKFTNGSTAVSPTLSVNGGTAFPISWPGGALASIEANQVLDMVFQFGSTGGFNVVGSANNPNNVTNASGGATSDGEIPIFSDTTGKAIKGSGVNLDNLADKNFVDQQVNGLAPMYEILASQALQIPFSASNVEDAYLIRLNLPSFVTSSPNGIETLKSLVDTSNCVFYATLTPITNIDTLGDNSEVMILIESIFTSARYLMFGSNRVTGKIIKAISKTGPIIGLRCESNNTAVRLVGIDAIVSGSTIYYPDGTTSDENLIEKLQTPFVFSSKSPAGNGLTFDSNLTSDDDVDKLKTYIENGGIIHLSLLLGSSWESMQSGVSVSIGIARISLEGTCFLTFTSGGSRQITGTELRRKAEQGVISVRYRNGNFEVLYWDSIITDDNKILYYNGDTVEFTEG